VPSNNRASKDALRARLQALQVERRALGEALAKTPLSDVDTIRTLAALIEASNRSFDALAVELEALHEQADS
jgi:hypothetical protein